MNLTRLPATLFLGLLLGLLSLSHTSSSAVHGNNVAPSVAIINRATPLPVSNPPTTPAPVPEFAEINLSDPFLCKCVDCKRDKVCGGIWKGGSSTDNESPVDLETLKIHIVVSHCKSDLDWISDYIEGFAIASIRVISKCGKEVVGAPEMADIELRSNTGGFDHTYAYYITTVLPQMVKAGEENESVAIFLKDDLAANFHKSGHRNDFESLVIAAASEHGFGCGITPGSVDFGQHSFVLSAYHGKQIFAQKTYHLYSMHLMYELYIFIQHLNQKKPRLFMNSRLSVRGGMPWVQEILKRLFRFATVEYFLDPSAILTERIRRFGKKSR